MINLTVKTMDSRNHEFEVEDDITVGQFKEHIASQIDIPAERQRIIYCGRVLKNELKLREYDVDGKVVHLVQRAPPSHRTPAPEQEWQRPANPPVDNIYLGSMQIPSTFIEASNPPPTHSLAASRLNVAKRMLRRTEIVLNQLENPTVRSEPTPPEEPQEEVTPVFEARVIVPNTMNEPIDEGIILSAVQNTLFPPASSSSGSSSNGNDEARASTSSNNASASQQIDDAEEAVENTSESSSPDRTPATTPPEEGLPPNASDAQQGSQSGNAPADNISPTSEMADLLDQLARIQIRLAPFLEQYQSFMRSDPAVSQEDTRKTQTMLNRVSEVLHFLGHAYHSLSDIIVRVRTPPPRPLLCRPILIQHSAVLQTGIPIQVEAEININQDLRSAFAAAAASNQTASSGGGSNGTAAASGNEASGNTSENGSGAAPNNPPTSEGPRLMSATPRQQVFRFPIGGIHVESVPIPIQLGGLAQMIHTTNNQGNEEPQNLTTTSSDANATTTGPSADGQAPSGPQPPQQQQPTNPSSVFRTNIPVPPPDFIQSIMQVAGQLMTRGAPGLNFAAGIPSQQPTAPPQEASSSAASTMPSTQAGGQASATTGQTTGQNSQARGNTSTNPTTATHTRTSSRPHVHLAQHAMQGFDPFLPCNSHHVTNRRRTTAIRSGGQIQINSNAARFASVPVGGMTAQANNQFNPIYNLVQGILNSFQTAVRQRATPPPPAHSQPTGSRPPAAASQEQMTIPPGLAALFPNLQNMNLTDLSPQGPTIAQLLQQIPDDTYVEGESIFNDLIMFLSRNFTLYDVMQLNRSRLEPLIRIRKDLRNFFLFRVLNGAPTLINTERGVDRLLNEMQPVLENFERLNVRDDIDIVKSVHMLLYARLPNIITLAASNSPNSLRMLVEQCKITARQLIALLVYASANGQQGVVELLEQIVLRYMTGISQEVQQWTIVASRLHLQQYISNVHVPESILQPYIIRKADSLLPVAETPSENNTTTPAEATPVEERMDVDEQEPSGSSGEAERSTLPQLNLADDQEPLPKVVIGSEGWHNQVPPDWVPLIARDSQRQRRQSQQPAFSDAYLSGMPSKRRKIVASSKPQGSLPQVITESVRRAVTATGLANVSNLETVSQAAGSDINIRSAYRELLRSSVQSNLQDNEDFTPERFPNASNYFSKPQ